MNNDPKLTARKRVPIAVISGIAKDTSYPEHGVPIVTLNLLFDLDTLEAMVKEAREHGSSTLAWNVQKPQLKMLLETFDRAKMDVQETEYFKRAVTANDEFTPLQITSL